MANLHGWSLGITVWNRPIPCDELLGLFSRQPELLNVTGNDWQAEKETARNEAQTAALVDVVGAAAPMSSPTRSKCRRPIHGRLAHGKPQLEDEDVASSLVRLLGE